MIRGQKRALDKRPSVNVDLKASIHNRFDIEVVDAKTGEVKQRAQAENVICDYLWTQMFAGTAWNVYIQYGSGNGTPSASDTGLFNYVGYGTPATGNDVKSFDPVNHVASLRRKITLSETTAVGINLTEVGISKNTSGSVCTHAMLQDMNGNQISITKTDTDIINIYSTVFAHWSGEYDDYFAIDDYEAGYSYLLQYALGTYSAPYGTNFYLSGTGGSSVYVSDPSFSYSLESKSCTIKFPRFAASVGNDNDGGFSIASFESAWMLRVDSKWFSPPTITGESIGTGDGATKDFKTAFRDVRNVTVYVDGTPAVVSVDPAFPFASTSGVPAALIPRRLDGSLMARLWGVDTESGSSVYVSLRDGILENPNSSVFGIAKVYPYGSNHRSLTLYASEDMAQWTLIEGPTTGTISIPEGLQRSRYFKTIIGTSGTTATWGFSPDVATEYNIHFTEAPVEGAVITADYTPGVIAKDVNHVFDFQIKFTFGEYTE